MFAATMLVIAKNLQLFKCLLTRERINILWNHSVIKKMKEKLYFPTSIKTYGQNGLQEINALAQVRRNPKEGSLKI